MAMHNFSASNPNAIALLYLQAPQESWTGVARMAERLSVDERDRADRFRFERDRNAFVAAHALLRFALRQATGRADWPFGQGPHGKPLLAGGPDLDFNITHTPGLAACGLAARGVEGGGTIGVDAELRARVVDADGLAERWFTADERRWLGAGGAARGERFIRLWTLKEAVIKATGQGLSLDLGTFSVTVDPCAVRFDQGPDPAWRLGLTLLPHHSLAVALRREETDPAPLVWREVAWRELLD